MLDFTPAEWPENRSAQALFNRAYIGVMLQGRPSANRHGACCYRGVKGTACGVGHLVDDETAKEWDYKTSSGIGSIINEMDVVDPNYGWLKLHERLLWRLQEAHDFWVLESVARQSSDTYLVPFPVVFHREMRDVAEQFSLTVPDLSHVPEIAAALA